MDPIWCVMPVVNRLDLTQAAVRSLLDQSVPTQVLLILQGVDDDMRAALENWAAHEPRLHLWAHQPPLPSLAASWNAGLRFVWSQGGEVALVANNDIVCHPLMIANLESILRSHNALFVSAVGVRPEQFTAFAKLTQPHDVAEVVWDVPGECLTRGGPDFSCFLLHISGHEKYPFDEGFTPAYCEDLDAHRRYILGGDGDRIFSVNLPFAHHASATLNADPSKAEEWGRKIAVSRARYARKWGGPVNGERFTIPFDAETDQDGVTTPELFEHVRAGWRGETGLAETAR